VAAAASPYDSRSDVLRGVEWWESHARKLTVDEPAVRVREAGGL
jgi:hypothetical protein